MVKPTVRILCEGDDVALSPDGNKVYLGRDYDGAFIADLENSTLANMVKVHERGYKGQWSPDGKALAISSENIHVDSLGPGLFILDHEGNNKQFVAKLELNDAYIQWSPDGKKLLIRDGHLGLHLVNRDGSNLIRLTSKTSSSGGAWSPDSKRIAYCDREPESPHLILFDVTTSRKEKLRSDIHRSIIWKPFTDQVIANYYDERRGDYFLAYVDTNTGKLEIFRKNDWGFDCETWSCSPNGKYIVDWYERERGPWGLIVEKGLGLLNLQDNKGLRVMSESSVEGDYRGSKFSWSMDSTKFVFGTGKVYVVSLNEA